MANGDDWGTEIQLKDYADLSFETRELLRKNQHGIDQKVIGEADAWWGTGEILRTNPQLAADALYEVRDQSPTKPRVPIGERVQQIPQVVADGVQDGILSAKINYLNYQELTGELSPEEVLTQTQVFRSQMSDPDNLNDDGLALETIGTAAEIGGGMLPAFAAGVKRALGISPAVGIAADKLVAPKKLGAPKVGKAAAAAAPPYIPLPGPLAPLGVLSKPVAGLGGFLAVFATFGATYCKSSNCSPYSSSGWIFILLIL